MICSECETEYTEKTCPECDCRERYTKLENQSERLADELNDRLTDLELAKKTVKYYEKSVADIRKIIQENDIAMRDFKWWTGSE